MKALIVDDEQVVRDVLAKLLELRNVESVGVEDGKSAEEELERHHDFDIVFLDLILPYISGWEVLDWIEEHRDTNKVPVVLMTGAVLSDQEHEKLQKRVAGILHKQDLTKERVDQLLDTVIGPSPTNLPSC